MEHDQPISPASPELDLPRDEALSPEDQHLLTFVRDRDVLCPLCGYNLRALTVPRCPECGQALKLTVGLAELSLKAWLACTAATCLSAGVGVVLALILIRAGSLPPFNSTFKTLHFLSFPAMIPVAALFLIGRRAFLRCKPERQSVFAALTVVIIAAQFLTIFSWLG